jgi:hypothetical protein
MTTNDHELNEFYGRNGKTDKIEQSAGNDHERGSVTHPFHDAQRCISLKDLMNKY